MSDYKGLLALFTACLLLCIIINFLLFYKNRKTIQDLFILAAVLLFNQLLEFITSFWLINHPILNFLFINTFNLSISLSGFYLLNIIQPGSKHNWKAFLFTIMMLPAGFVFLSSFAIVTPGLFFTEYRYFASPLANVIIGLLQALFGIFFLAKLFFENQDLRKILHYRLLLWGYLTPVLVFAGAVLISIDSILIFESLFSKLLILNLLSLSYFIIIKNK